MERPCSSCGARAKPGARWCAVCLTSFEPRPESNPSPAAILEPPAWQRPVRVALDRGTGPTRVRMQAVLIALLAICFGLLLMIGTQVICSFGTFLGITCDPGTPGELFWITSLTGVALGAALFWVAGVTAELSVEPDGLEIRYAGFRRPMRVARESVRAVAIDDAPTILFQQNKRFRVHGRVPDEAFADPLEPLPRMPGDPIPPFEIPRDPLGDRDARVPLGSGPDRGRPEDAGWALGHEHARGEPTPAAILDLFAPEAYLYSGDGSSLPVLRHDIVQIPNVAILFTGRLPTPRWSIRGLILASQMHLYLGGGLVPGVMVRARSADLARAAFEPWGVVRDITRDDVLDEGLRLPKPLRGWRILAYAVVLLMPLLLRLLIRQ